jgi:CubicO group peptidase (beta-lactamase class C family)
MTKKKNTPFRVLFREFLFRMVDLELLSAKGDMSTLLGQFAALLIFISLTFVLPAFEVGSVNTKVVPPQVSLMLSLSGEHFLIATTMLAVGLFAVLSWDSTFPNKRDVFVLAPLPISTSTLFLAKIAAVGSALTLTVLALHCLAGLAWPGALYAQAREAPTPALTYEAAMPPVDATQMQAVLDRDLTPARAPNGALAPGSGVGAVVGVFRNGQRRIFSYGAVKPDSIFEISSISKTFTSLILAQMAAQEKVGLGEPVGALLPKGKVQRPLQREISLVDLATHHSGLPYMPDNMPVADKNNPYADYNADLLYASVAKQGLARGPRTPWVYSNLGYGLLGEALAYRAGTTFPELLRQQVTEPLDMPDTVVTLSASQRSRFARGMNHTGQSIHEWDMDALAGAGGIRSTAGDMLKFLEAQLHPERLTFDANDPAAATLPAAIANSQKLREDAVAGNRIALAWMYLKENATYWHDGATSGYCSYVFFQPKGDYAAVVLVNQAAGLAPFADTLGEHIRQRFAGEPVLSLANVLVPPSRGLVSLVRVYAVYWITMFGAGAFIFCFVLGLQGLAAQLLPRRWFLRVSSFLQLAVFVVFLGGYLAQPIVVTPARVWAAQNHGPLYWSPSYWFLGLFQQLNGSPALAPLALRAWIGIAMVFTLTTTAYVLAYFRTLRKIVEEPDIVSSSGGRNWLPRFGNPLATAVTQFSIRTLLRSRQHRMILAFYWGIALAFVILNSKGASMQRSLGGSDDPWHQASIPWIIASVLVLAAAIVGIRVVAALPLDIRANWIFQITPLRGGSANLAAVRRAFYVLGMAPVWCAFAAMFLVLWPWAEAIGHLAVLALLGITLTEICLTGFHKIPFTCTYLPGNSQANMAFLAFIGFIAITVRGAETERAALDDPRSGVQLLLVLAIVAGAAWWRTSRRAKSSGSELNFEEEPPPVIEALNLHRDGAPPVITA